MLISAEEAEIKELNREVERLEQELKTLRRDMDNIKVRAYELVQRELHDMAWAALQGGE